MQKELAMVETTKCWLTLMQNCTNNVQLTRVLYRGLEQMCTQLIKTLYCIVVLKDKLRHIKSSKSLSEQK